MSNNGAPLDGKFNQFYSDLATAKSTLGSAPLTLYSDALGSTVVADTNNNPVQGTIVSYTMYTYGQDFMPSSNSDTGFIRIVFRGNSRFEVQNTTEPTYWYSFDGGNTIVPLQ